MIRISPEVSLLLYHDTSAVIGVVAGEDTEHEAAERIIQYWSSDKGGDLAPARQQLRQLILERTPDQVAQLYRQAADAWENGWIEPGESQE